LLVFQLLNQADVEYDNFASSYLIEFVTKRCKISPLLTKHFYSMKFNRPTCQNCSTTRVKTSKSC